MPTWDDETSGDRRRSSRVPALVEKLVMSPVTTAGKAVADWIAPPTEPMAYSEIPGATARAIRDVVIPPTAAGKGAALGALLPQAIGMIPHPAAQAFRGAGPLVTALSAGAGAEIASQVAGEAPLGDVAPDAMATTYLAERVLGPAGAAIARMAPGGKRRAAEVFARDVGRTLNEIAPSIPLATTSAELATTLRLAPGQVLQAPFPTIASAHGGLRNMIAAARRDIDQTIGGQNLQLPLNLAVPGAQPVMAQSTTYVPGMTWQVAQQMWVGPATHQEIPLAGAFEALSKLYERGYAGKQGDALTRSMTGIEARQAAGHLRAQIATNLRRLDPSGDALTLFEQSQHEFAVGLTMTRQLQNLFQLSPSEVNLDSRQVQRQVFQKLSKLSSMTPAELNTYLNTVFRGGTFGADILASGQGRMLDALRQTYGRGQGGSPQLLGAPLRTFLPDIGSQHTGRRAPLQLSRPAQALVDVGTQRAGQEILDRLQ